MPFLYSSSNKNTNLYKFLIRIYKKKTTKRPLISVTLHNFAAKSYSVSMVTKTKTHRAPRCKTQNRTLNIMTLNGVMFLDFLVNFLLLHYAVSFQISIYKKLYNFTDVLACFYCTASKTFAPSVANLLFTL